MHRISQLASSLNFLSNSEAMNEDEKKMALNKASEAIDTAVSDSSSYEATSPTETDSESDLGSDFVTMEEFYAKLSSPLLEVNTHGATPMEEKQLKQSVSADSDGFRHPRKTAPAARKSTSANLVPTDKRFQALERTVCTDNSLHCGQNSKKQPPPLITQFQGEYMQLYRSLKNLCKDSFSVKPVGREIYEIFLQNLGDYASVQAEMEKMGAPCCTNLDTYTKRLKLVFRGLPYNFGCEELKKQLVDLGFPVHTVKRLKSPKTYQEMPLYLVTAEESPATRGLGQVTSIAGIHVITEKFKGKLKPSLLCHHCHGAMPDHSSGVLPHCCTCHGGYIRGGCGLSWKMPNSFIRRPEINRHVTRSCEPHVIEKLQSQRLKQQSPVPTYATVVRGRTAADVTTQALQEQNTTSSPSSGHTVLQSHQLTRGETAASLSHAEAPLDNEMVTLRAILNALRTIPQQTAPTSAPVTEQ